MLNNYDFMGIICMDIRFISKNTNGGPSTNTAHMRLAISQDWDRKSHDKSSVFFCTVICFGKMAAYIHKYGRKGDLIVGRGYLRNGHWKNDANEDCYSTDVVAERIYLYILNDPRRKKYADKNGGKLPNFKVDYVEPGAVYSQIYGYNRTRPNDCKPIIDGIPEEPPDDMIFHEWGKK